MNLLEQARRLSVEAHAGQFRKWHPSVAYVAHCDRVRARMLELGYNDTIGVAAQLHDVFEDCHRMYRDMVAEQFGPDVYVIVHELTNPSKGLHGNRALRKAIDREHMGRVSVAAALIKMADRTDNLQDCLIADHGFKRLYYEESTQLLGVLDSVHRFSKGDESTRTLYRSYCTALDEVKASL